ncbi:hypothetical protein EYF80_052480 [Liparis tanakae]|uniref:Uncharacterized protein n=1 Tax=Liparis tanakae TaxID=230148 RepID=A0A4Z2F8M2_9TELE|nr:hypothetical protein EYF80_052480 [Liparis tanakae]
MSGTQIFFTRRPSKLRAYLRTAPSPPARSSSSSSSSSSSRTDLTSRPSGRVRPDTPATPTSRKSSTTSVCMVSSVPVPGSPPPPPPPPRYLPKKSSKPRGYSHDVPRSSTRIPHSPRAANIIKKNKKKSKK